MLLDYSKELLNSLFFFVQTGLIIYGFVLFIILYRVVLSCFTMPLLVLVIVAPCALSVIHIETENKIWMKNKIR